MADPLDAPGLDDALAARLLALEPRLRVALEAERAEGAARRQTLARRLVEAKRLPDAEVAEHLAALVSAAAAEETSRAPAAAPGPAPPAPAAAGEPVRRAALPRRLGPGDRVGGHVVERRLGEGGMGTVYAARQEGTGALRALKVLDLDAAPDRLARFQREAEAMARVDDHPNVLRVLGAGADAGLAYLVLELVPGGDLAARFAECGPLDPDVACGLVEPLCGALAHLHARGILHRDLKPQNVLLDAEGRPRLADFGLAAITGAEALTRTGAIVGSPAYMAPEQVGGRAGVDARTDIYGLGAVLYELLTGRPPFGEGCLAHVLAQVMTEPPTSVRQLAPGVSRDLEAVCLRCLAKDPADRYPDALALAADLVRARRGEPLAAGPARRRRGAVSVLAGLGAAGLVAVAAAAGLRREEPEGPGGGAAAPADGPRATAAGAHARGAYLARCRAPFGLGPQRLAAELASHAAGLGPDDARALAAEKARALAEPAWIAGLRARLAVTEQAREALEELVVLVEAAPRVPLPDAVGAELDGALRVWLDAYRLRGDARAVEAFAELELLRARALGYARRPPQALVRWLDVVAPSARRERAVPLPTLRALLWADVSPSLSGLRRRPGGQWDVELAFASSARLDALGPVDPAALVAAEAREPGSQALALLRLAAARRRGPRVGGQDTAARALADARAAASDPPSDLGPRWRRLARIVLAELLAERLREATGPAPPPDGRVAEAEALGRELHAVTLAELRVRVAEVRDLPPEFREGSIVWGTGVEFRAWLHRGLVARRQLPFAREGRAAWAQALEVARPLLALDDDELRALVVEQLLAAAEAHLQARDAGAAAHAAEALGVATRPEDRLGALAALLRAHLELPELFPALAEVEARHLPDAEALQALLTPPPTAAGDGPSVGWTARSRELARVAVRAASARGDRALAHARVDVGLKRSAIQRLEIGPLLAAGPPRRGPRSPTEAGR